ncbi:MAG: sensor histidine kinase [Solirubrobacterales bacterium]
MSSSFPRPERTRPPGRDRTSPFRSATFRLTLLAVPLFLAAGWALLAFVYVNTHAIMDRRVNAGLSAERQRLVEDLQPAERPEVIDALHARVVAERGSARLYLLADEAGDVLVANFNLAKELLPRPGAFADVTARRGSAEVPARLLAVWLPSGLTLVLGRDLAEEHQFRLVIEETLAIAVVLTVLLALGAGAVTSRAVLRRLGGFNAIAARMLHGDLKERMPVSGSGDEFDHLAENLNESLDRISELMAATRQVTDNIAHDLRGPLSRIRNRMELALVTGMPRDELEELLALSVDDVDSLLGTFESLLAIARLEHGVSPDFATVELAPLIEDLVDYFQPLAEEKSLELSADTSAGGAVRADRNLLFQALSNIVDNAVRYTPEGGHIAVRLGQQEGGAAVVIADDGPGIPAESRADVLKRFVRLDASRHQPGNGLGLAVVDAVARHHHARLVLDDNAPGLRVSLILPMDPDSAPART